MKVSFDFDNTLGWPHVQEYAKYLIKNSIEVWITTSRILEESNEVVYDVASNLEIPGTRIIFTSHVPKWNFMQDFIWHLDDMEWEIDLINKYTETKGILIWGQNNWKEDCTNLLQ